ncbi:MAG TPA: hypothetical protein VFT60_08170 [Bryobacteraceae bacterium]|nr:hypothetical protein [Bryobacteraceae bacterium]
MKPQEKIVPALQDAAPAIEEAPILASGLPQKSSTVEAKPRERVEHKHTHQADGDTPDAETQAVAAAVPLPIHIDRLPLHMALPVSSAFHHPLTPLGNRIPVVTPVAVRAETPAAPADPFHSDNDKDHRPALRAETARPMVTTADQLAFAAKVQVAKPQQQSSRRDSDSPLSMKPGETAPATLAGESILTSKPGSTESTRPSNAPEDIMPTRPEVPAAPMKDISVRIQSEKGENVDVRILHRAGDVQIAVKSADGETTQGLRHGLSELSDRLNASGYHADTWHPVQAPAAADNRADSGNSQYSQQQQSQGDSQSHSGWSQQQGGRRDDNQSNRPHWIDELESKISSPAETGIFHGLIR